MKKRWNTRRFLPILLLLGVLLACGSVFAYMFKRTDPLETQFIPAEVTCEVYDDKASGDEINEVTVKNTGNIPAYLRVRLVTYWDNGDGKVAPKNSHKLTVDYDETKWVAGSDNTFYYRTAVDPDEATTDLFAEGACIQMVSDGGYKQRVDIFGEAIQADPARAATSSWGVTITDGKITAAP